MRALAAILTLPLAAAVPAAAAEFDSNTFGGLKARSIGPAVMSGRIAAIDAVAEDPLTIFVGAASGGVWKSKDGGVTFSPVFDDHDQSIGAIAVDPGDPQTVWVGTGESCVRNSVSVGSGVYRSGDGGSTWEGVGLKDSERIARIVVDPRDGDTVYVCATGHLWDSNAERGVFKSSDGGTSWQQVLFVDEETGCSDLAIDPQRPEILYAGMWQFRRYPDFFTSGGPGSGLYKTIDGGATWREVTAGLPPGEKGRIAVAVAPSRPSRVYAVVEAETTALYRSDDLGESWTEANRSPVVSMRPFYFSHLVVDPVDFDRVYKPGLLFGYSEDGGETFSTTFPGIHPDLHALWIDPRNPQSILLGTDGGVYISEDRGAHFRHVKTLPVSQFYEVGHDQEWPYNVYGGLQDNGSWTGPSRALGGVRDKDWRELGIGDGFHSQRDLRDPDYVYVEFQGGKLLRHHLPTGQIKWIAPLPGAGEPDYRFNWNTPLHLPAAGPGTLLYGAQFLFRSRDQGDSWEKISPDLTTNDPRRQRQKESGGLSVDNSTAENNATIFTISASPLDGRVIWAGTDDGRLQVTGDGGATWTDVFGNLPDAPPGTWVSHVEASPHDAAVAHVALDGHRTGDMAARLFRTADRGATWTSIAGDGIEGFVHVVAQDPVRPSLLYAGTERGLFITLDGGEHWARFGGDLPRVPVYDLDVHPRDHDLIIGTHGRGIYILDDLTPLRHLTPEVMESSVALLPSRPAVMVLSSLLQYFPGDDEFVGRNPPAAASIVYYLKKRHIFGDLKVEVFDADGELVSTLPGGKRVGLNRVDWPMRLPPPKMPPATSLTPAFAGPRMPEGTYRFRLTKGKETLEGEIALVPDPRSPYAAEDRLLQQRTALELYALLERLTYVVDAAEDLEAQATSRAGEDGVGGRLEASLRELAAELESFRGSLVSTAKGGRLAGDEKLREKLGNLYGAVSGYDGRPTRSQLDGAAFLGGEVVAAEERLASLSGEALTGLNERLERRDLEPLTPLDPEAWREREKVGTAAAATLGRRPLERLWGRIPILFAAF